MLVRFGFAGFTIEAEMPGIPLAHKLVSARLSPEGGGNATYKTKTSGIKKMLSGVGRNRLG